MITIDIRLKESEVIALRSLIGKQLMSIQHDSFVYTNSSSQVVQINTSDGSFYLYSFTEPLDYYGSTEDVAVWSFDKERNIMVDHKDFIETPFNEIVKGISLIQENQKLYNCDDLIYDVYLTRGIIIDFGDRQLSFEKAAWFSEDIYIQKGYELINKFNNTKDFVNSDWDDGFRAECTRETIIL